MIKLWLVPRINELFSRLLCLATPPTHTLVSSPPVDSFVLATWLKCSYCHGLGHNLDTCYSLQGLQPKNARVAQTDTSSFSIKQVNRHLHKSPRVLSLILLLLVIILLVFDSLLPLYCGSWTQESRPFRLYFWLPNTLVKYCLFTVSSSCYFSQQDPNKTKRSWTN